MEWQGLIVLGPDTAEAGDNLLWGSVDVWVDVVGNGDQWDIIVPTCLAELSQDAADPRWAGKGNSGWWVVERHSTVEELGEVGW